MYGVKNGIPFYIWRIYTKNNKWYWIDCNHPFSRKQKLEQLI